MNIGLIPLLLSLSLITSACAPHKPASQQTKKPHVKTVKHLNMSAMQAPFLYLASQDAVKDGQYALAIELLSALIQKDPEATKPHLQLIELLLQSAHYDQAHQHIAGLLQQNDLQTAQRERLELTEVRLFVAQNKVDMALDKLNIFLKIHPKHLDAYDLKSKLLAGQNRFNDALATLKKAINIKELPAFRLLQAQLFIKQQNISAAKSSLIRMQKLAPHHDTPVLLLSSLAIKEKKLKSAESQLRSFLDEHPNAFRISQALGQLLIQNQRPIEAIQVYRQAAEQSGNNPEILRALGMLYFRMKNYDEAEKAFSQAVKGKADNSTLFYLGASLEALERTSEAHTIYQKIDPTSSLASEAKLRLAAINIMDNNIKQAIQQLKSILSEKSMHLDALLMLSTIRLSQGKLQQLIDETDIITGVPKLPAQLLFNRAVAFENLKKYEQVESTLNRLLKTNPSHAEAMNFLAYTYAIQGIKLAKAEALIHRALILKPDNGYYLDSLAWIYYKGGNFSKAIKTQAQALEKISEDAVMYEHYGDMLWQHGDKKAARSAWQKAIQLNSQNRQVIKNKISQGLSALQ